jgi:hypothetical protein
MISDLFIVDVFKEVAEAMKPNLEKSGLTVNFTYGRGIQILTKLQALNNSITQKNMKYPLMALFMPFQEKRGIGYEAQVRFPKIVIATLSNSTDYPEKRYDMAFRPILYPVYNEFIKQLALHPNIVGMNENNIPHYKQDNPGSPPPSKNNSGGIEFGDFVDSIDIYNLDLIFQNNNFC